MADPKKPAPELDADGKPIEPKPKKDEKREPRHDSGTADGTFRYG
jgi:hypothetical protein